MSAFTAAISDSSEQFLPAFAMTSAAPAGGTACYASLDFNYDDRGPLPSDGETVVGRWLAYGSGLFTVTASGRPVRAGVTETGRPAKLFDGPFDVLVTDRRILVLVFDGSTVLGRVGGRSGHILLAVYPLDKIDSIDVRTKSGLTGTKERTLTIMTLTGAAAALALDDVSMEWDGLRFTRFRGTKRLDIMERLVAPIAAARRPLATEADLRQLDAVLAGARLTSPTETAVQFAAG